MKRERLPIFANPRLVIKLDGPLTSQLQARCNEKWHPKQQQCRSVTSNTRITLSINLLFATVFQGLFRLGYRVTNYTNALRVNP